MPSNPIFRVAKTTTQVYVDSDPSCSAVAETTSPAAAPPFCSVFRRLGKNPTGRFPKKTPTNSFTPIPGWIPIQVLPPSQDFQGWPYTPRLHPVAFRIHASAVHQLNCQWLKCLGPFMAEGLMKTIGKLPE